MHGADGFTGELGVPRRCWYGEEICPVRLESRSAIDVAAVDPDVRLDSVLERTGRH
jgi:hypothetical protein